MDTSTRMPALYIGHGAPPLLDDPVWSAQLASLAADLPRPRSILIVSAHWESAPLALSATGPGVDLVYDFGGFAERYYRMTYRTPAATALAERVVAMMPDTERVHQHASRGLDHGAWVPLKIMYPRRRHPRAADVPADAGPRQAAGARRPVARAARRGRAGHRLRLPHPRPAVPQRVPDRRRGPRAGRSTSTSGQPRPSPAATWPSWRRTAPGRRGCPTPTRPSSTTPRSSSPSAPPRTPRLPGDQIIDGYWMGLSKRSLLVA